MSLKGGCFLECVENKLSQLLHKPTRGAALLDLLFTKREGLVGDVVTGGCLVSRDHDIIIEFFTVLLLGEY